MKRKQNGWIPASLLTLAMFFATIYSIVAYPESVMAVGITGLLCLGSAFWLFLSISKLSGQGEEAEETSAEEQKEQMQFEGMMLQGEELLRLMNTVGKGTYISTKRSSEHLEALLSHIFLNTSL